MHPDGRVVDIDLAPRIGRCALAFRGYNVTNMGRTGELLAHPVFGPTVREHLNEASAICSEAIGRRVDLVLRVQQGLEPSLDEYAESIALIMAMELAQLKLAEEHFGVNWREAVLSYGYSLGEIAALTASGVISLKDALNVPLAMAADCAELAHDVTMGIVFSRGPAVDARQVDRLCQELNVEGRGVIGISSYLAPNSLLVLGQQDTVDRLTERLRGLAGPAIHVRKNLHRWPPLHTPIVWQRAVPNRARVMMHTIKGGFARPTPPIVSLVTGKMSYTEDNCRELVGQWIDHPQRLWDAVCATLSAGVTTVIHVGPEPNLIVATFERLAANVREQTQGRSLSSLSMRAVGGIARQAWLRAMLPHRAALLHAPQLEHVILEDWLLAKVSPKT